MGVEGSGERGAGGIKGRKQRISSTEAESYSTYALTSLYTKTTPTLILMRLSVGL